MPSTGIQKAAANKVQAAVACGRLRRSSSCDLCSGPCDPVAHHHLGYGHPLAVWWICRACNKILEHKHDGALSLDQAKAYVRSRGVTMKKSDNANLPAKLDLRRYMLDKYHAEAPPRVVDCCQGQGVIWKQLRQEYQLESYFGLDQKPKSGRLKMASERYLALPGWNQNVIDIDTWGSPYGHWRALLPNVICPATVFLTVGAGGTIGRNSLETAVRNVLGLGAMKVPAAIGAKLNRMILPHMLALSREFGKTVIEAVEAESGGNSKCVGVRLDVS